MQDFRNLEVWRRSYELTLQVYQATRSMPAEEKYGLVSQMRRCSVSIPANIAEGCGRETKADLKRFLHIAMGSASELECQLLLAADLDFMNSDMANDLIKHLTTTKKMLNALIGRIKAEITASARINQKPSISHQLPTTTYQEPATR